MIRVTVELLPKGYERNIKHLGTAYISNDGTGTPTRGNYDVRLSKKNMPNSTWKTGRVTNFPRKALGVWDLLYIALNACIGSK